MLLLRMVLFSSKYQKTFVVRLYMKYHSDIQLAILPMNRWQNNVQGESTWFLFANAWSVRLLDHHYCCFFCCEYLWNFFLSWHFLGKIFLRDNCHQNLLPCDKLFDASKNLVNDCGRWLLTLESRPLQIKMLGIFWGVARKTE